MDLTPLDPALKYGAGAILLHGSEMLLQQRSETEHEPLTWSIYGGMVERGETLSQAMLREVREESGIDVSAFTHQHLHRYTEPGFEFHTYVVWMPHRATPVHSTETNDAGWFCLGSTPDTLWQGLPSPLHSGFLQLTAETALRTRLLSFLAR